MINYPVAFEAKAESLPGISVPWKVSSELCETNCSVPSSFEGPGEGFSPEDFFLLALQNCFIATFKVFAEYSRLSYQSLNVEARLIVDKDETGKPWMDKVHLKIHFEGVTDLKKANLLVNKTMENGFILRSVKTNITMESNLHL